MYPFDFSTVRRKPELLIDRVIFKGLHTAIYGQL